MKLIRCIPYCCLMALFLLSACEDTIPRLPLETQSGENTFGCLINGELIVAEYTHTYVYNPPRPRAWYYSDQDTLMIEGHGQNNQTFRFFIAHPTLDTEMIDRLEYTAPGYRFVIKAEKVNGIRFSRFDEQVVSGTFAFQLDTVLKPAADPLLNVTMGRFDIPLQ